MQEALLECKDVIRIYESTENKVKIPALRGIDLKIKEGELMAIIGPSGAGKTTLVNLLGMLDRPSSGEIILNSAVAGKVKYSATNMNELVSLRRQVFGFLFQQPGQNLLYNLTALQNILFPMKIADKLTREEQRKRAFDLARMVGIEKRINHKPSKISGGEAQRLGLCIALANDPPIVLADEPTGELDSMNTFSMINYLRELNESLGKTFIVVTHDHRFQSMTDITYKIQDGKITALHKPKDASKDYMLREDFGYVSDDGGVKIPEVYLQRHGIRRIIRFESAEDHIKIIPVKEEV
ncbi:MAG: ABC transporter ATP-binding protein [Candidatus Hodarchaeales archaeon]|jgi:ABC-type lipoprotein export system ATPase subunit